MKVSTLENIYKLYMADIYKYLFSLCRQAHAAEDLTQDTFVKVYEHLESYKGEKVKPWLFRVAHNTYIDWYRKNKRFQDTDPYLLDSFLDIKERSPEENYIFKEKISSWLNALNNLTESNRQLIILRDYHGFSYNEISEITGLTLSNVKIKILRSRKKIKEVLSKYEL